MFETDSLIPVANKALPQEIHIENVEKNECSGCVCLYPKFVNTVYMHNYIGKHTK